MNIPIELKTRIYEHIGIVRQHLEELPPDELREILQSLETHIHDALESKTGGEPSMELLEAILAEMDPPESYGSEQHPAATQPHPDKETPTIASIKARSNPAKRVILVMVIVVVSFMFIMAGISVFLTLWAIARPSMKQASNSEGAGFNQPEAGDTSSDIQIQATKHPVGNLITAGVGWTDYVVGKTRGELIQQLGAPQTNAPPWLMRWDRHPDVEAIISNEGTCREIRFNKGFEGQTVSGVKIGTSVQEARSAYGKTELTWAKGPYVIAEWPSKGVLLYTEKGLVEQIIIFNPRPKTTFPFMDDATVHGQWISTDFIRTIQAFNPLEKAWKGDLFLKELTFFPDGETSLAYTWTNGRLVDNDSISAYTLKEIEGEVYLFMEWMSGDVTVRGNSPQFYVLKRRE